MTRTFLFLLLLANAGSMLAQQLPSHVSELAQNPELLTPELSLALSKKGIDENGYLPPVDFFGYNMNDSIYYYDWDASISDWALSSRDVFVNDCQLGRPILRLGDGATPPPVQFYPVNKTEWSYFPSGDAKTTKEAVWDESPAGWVPTFFDSLLSGTNSLERWYKAWNTAQNKYTNGDRLIFTRDNDGKVLVTQEQAWDTDLQDWAFELRTTYTYENTNNTVQLDEVWDATSGQWLPSYKTDYTYNASNLPTERLHSYFDNSSFVPLERYTYAYDGNGNLTELLVEEFDEFNGQYTPLRRTEYTHDAANLLISSLDEVYTNGAWENEGRTERTYYPSGNLLTRKGFTWVPDTQSWLYNSLDSLRDDGSYLHFFAKNFYDVTINAFQFGYRAFFEYDAEGRTTQIKFDFLEFNTLDTWELGTLRNYEYDANGRTLETTLKEYDESLQDYVWQDKQHYYNTGCFYSLTDGVVEAPLCAHANPIRPGQPIHCAGPLADGPAQLELYSLEGKRVHAQSYSPGDGIQLERPLPNGLYLLLLQGQQGAAYRSKVVVME